MECLQLLIAVMFMCIADIPTLAQQALCDKLDEQMGN